MVHTALDFITYTWCWFYHNYCDWDTRISLIQTTKTISPVLPGITMNNKNTRTELYLQTKLNISESWRRNICVGLLVVVWWC